MSVVDDVCVVGLLGPVAVGVAPAGQVAGSVSVLREVAGVRARRLLASLALADGRLRSAERLIDDVWGDDPPRSPQAALHTQISRLRQVLGGGRLEGVGNGYRLVDCQTDLDIAAALIDDGDRASLDLAMLWWRGEPGADLADGELASEVRTRAANLAEARDRRRIALALDDGRYRDARLIAEMICAADPFDETAHLDLMRALAGEGRASDALSVFARFRRTLTQQLGADPGPQITAFNTALLSGGGPSPSRRGKSVGLRNDTSTLIGRDDDVAAIVALVDEHRLVTVQGPGGVGKTRVANRIGQQVADAGRSVYYVSLAPIRDEADVIPAIATVLGVGETDLSSGGRPRMAVADLSQRLVDAVRGEDALLILDNCEQVIDRCAIVVDELLTAAPELTVLTTSRSPLLLAAEQIYLLPVLGVDDDGPAVALFEARARAVRPDARLPRPQIIELCRHLDGLPLAIELAAARVRTMTVEEISSRLAERFALLRGPGRNVPDRHRTLHAVIEWSWQLLDSDAQQALRRLCRFPAGFTVDAASNVLGGNGLDIDEALESLVNQSLLRAVDEGGHIRYRMLEMVREFGEEKLAELESSLDVEAAHRDSGDGINRSMWRWARGFSISVQDSYDEGMDDALLTTVSEEVENLVWVLRDSIVVVEAESPAHERYWDAVNTVVTVYTVLIGYWMVRGLHVEMLTWAGRLIRALPVPPDDLDDVAARCWRMTVVASLGHQMMHRDLRMIGTARFYLRRLHHSENTFHDATEFLTACVLSRTRIGALRLLVRGVDAEDRVALLARGLRTNLRETLGLLDGAEQDALVLYETGRAQGDVWMSAMAEVSLGSIIGQQTQWARAVDYFRSGVADLEHIGAREDAAQSRCYLVALTVAHGDLDSAAAELDVLTDGWRPGDRLPKGNPEIVAGSLLAYAEYEVARGNPEVAAELYWEAGRLLATEHPLGARDPGMVMLVSVTAVGLMSVGRVAQARTFLPLMRDGVREMTSEMGWQDRPQAGTMALAAGLTLCAEPATRHAGAELMLLSRRLRARRDYPCLFAADRDMRQLSGLPDDEWEELLATTESVPRLISLTAVADLLSNVVVD